MQPVIDIAMSKAYDVTWSAMEKLVECGKTKLIGKNMSLPRRSTEYIRRLEFLESKTEEAFEDLQDPPCC